MVKKIIFLASLLTLCVLFFGKDVSSGSSLGLSEKIELAYAFTEKTNENRDFDLAQEAHFNAVLDYGLLGHSDEVIEDFLELCDQYGFKVFVPLPYYDKETDILNRAEIERQVKRWKSHPAVYSWYILDEPASQRIPKSRQEEFYNLVKSLDTRPVSIAVRGSNSEEKWQSYFTERAFDLLFFAMYPYVKGGEATVNLYMNLGITRFLSHKEGDYPVIPVIQAFYDSDESDYLNPTHHLQEMYEVFEDYQLVSNGLAFYAWRPGGNRIGIRADNSLYNEVKEIISLNEKTSASGSITIYPNPFNPGTGQGVRITNLSLDSQVVVAIFDIAGNRVRTLEENDEVILQEGSKTATWDGTNEAGENVARGVYLVFVTDEKGTTTVGKIAIVNK
ncbi:MAG: FlgD immunoglobulin-like domain containing protein [bacterium]